MAGMEAALMGVPVIRDIMGLQSFDQSLANQKMTNYVNSVQAAQRLAEIEAMPLQNRLRQAQLNKAEYDLQRAQEADKKARALYEQHMTPRTVPLHGPTQPGAAPLGDTVQQPTQEDFGAYVRALMTDPATAGLGASMAQSARQQWAPVGSGGLVNTITGARIAGGGNDAVSRAIANRDAAIAAGDMETAQVYEDVIQKLRTRAGGDSRIATLRRVMDLVKVGKTRPLTDEEKFEAVTLYQAITTPSMHSTPYGTVTQEGMVLPDLVKSLNQLLGGKALPVPQGQSVPPAQPAPAVPGQGPSGYDESWGAAGPSAGAASQAVPMPGQPPQGASPLPTPGVRPLAGFEGRPIDDKTREGLMGIRTSRETLEALERDFENAYALPKSMRLVNALSGGTIKDINYSLSRMGIRDEAISDWWTGMLKLIAGERHKLVGATLTNNEQRMFDRLVADMGDSPVRIRAALRRAVQEARAEEKSLAQTAAHAFNPKDVASIIDRPNPQSFGRTAMLKGNVVELEDMQNSGKTIRTMVRKRRDGTREGYVNGQWVPLGE